MKQFNLSYIINTHMWYIYISIFKNDRGNAHEKKNNRLKEIEKTHKTS